MGDLGWYARRLRTMSLPEFAWRVGRVAETRLPRRLTAHHGVAHAHGSIDWPEVLDRFRAGLDRPLVLDRARAAAVAARHPDEVARLVAAAERALVPEVEYFGHGTVRLVTPVDWSHDPVAGVRWPRVPATRIDHRTAPGDPKWIWELNRLQHLSWLAEAWLFTGRDEFADGALGQLDSWLTDNPPGRGIAWRGAYEAGVRAITVSLVLHGLRDSPSLDLPLFRRTVGMLASSADLCWRERSRFSSANNHLVGEMTGLLTVAAMFPELGMAPVWKQRALRTLTAEAARQILPDGAGAEQSVGYQLFTADYLVLVSALLRARGESPPEPVVEAVDRSATHLGRLVDGGDPEPRYGDDDGGFVLRLDVDPVPTVRRHLAAAAVLTGNGLARRNGQPGLAAAWLESIPGMPKDRVVGDAHVASTYAVHGGLVVLRDAGRRTTMDVGPLGYLSIAAHGHADALSVTLSHRGRELVSDPGTASYYAHPDWRRVHRGTRAHATVTVDDLDQSESGGPFLWTRHAQVRVRHVDLEAGVVDAEHDGYRRLRTPVSHRRLLVAPLGWPTILVLDLLEGAGEHHVRSSWPLHPSLHVRAKDGGHVASRDGRAVLALDHAVALSG